MFRKALALIVIAGMTCAAAPAAKTPPAKAPVAKAPAVKAPAPKAATAPAFDPRDPVTLVGLLNGVGAKAQVGAKTQDAVAVNVTSTAANFAVLFVGCSPQGKACQAAVYDSLTAGAPTLSQINSFNQSSAMCRGYQDKAGKAHVLYSVHTFATTSREQMLAQLGGWRGCLSDFTAFAKDPVSYLAEAP